MENTSNSEESPDAKNSNIIDTFLGAFSGLSDILVVEDSVPSEYFIGFAIALSMIEKIRSENLYNLIIASYYECDNMKSFIGFDKFIPLVKNDMEEFHKRVESKEIILDQQHPDKRLIGAFIYLTSLVSNQTIDVVDLSEGMCKYWEAVYNCLPETETFDLLIDLALNSDYGKMFVDNVKVIKSRRERLTKYTEDIESRV